MKIRAMLAIVALAGAVACGGGDTKKDEPATETSTGEVEGESTTDPETEEAPAETAPMDEEPAPEGAEEGGE